MYGIDILGLAHPLFKPGQVIKAVPEGFALGVFDDPFGDVIKKLRRLLLTQRYPAVRIHAHWANNHSIVPIKKLRQKLLRYQRLALDFPRIKVYVSHSCEHNETSEKEVRERIDLISELCPNCHPVNAVWQGRVIPGVINEKHGTEVNLPGRYIVSTDGINSYDIDADKYNRRHADAEIIFHWGARLNLREIYKEGQPVPPPSQRKASPSKRYIQSLVALCHDKNTAPTPQFNARPLQGGEIWKTHSEDHPGESSERENKPVLIVKPQADHAKIVTYTGKVIGKLAYEGTFPGGLRRYYSGKKGGINKFGFEIAKKAVKYSGSEYVWFKIGKQYIGPVNPGFREGIYRN